MLRILRIPTIFLSFDVSTILSFDVSQGSDLGGLDELGGFSRTAGAALRLSTLSEWHVFRTIGSFEEPTWCVLLFRCNAFELSSMVFDVANVMCDLSTVI